MSLENPTGAVSPQSHSTIAQQLSSPTLASQGRLGADHHSDSCAGGSPVVLHGERASEHRHHPIAGRSRGLVVTTPAMIRFAIAAEALGIEVRGWDGDYLGARIAMAQVATRLGRIA